MKIQIMRKNPEVCFQVENRVDQANWKSVITWGTFEELNEGEPNRLLALERLTCRRLPFISSVVTHLGGKLAFSA